MLDIKLEYEDQTTTC